MKDQKIGTVFLVGAGPGDPLLLTLKAKELIEKADFIFYDYLCNPEILDWASNHCRKVYVGKIAGKAAYSQREIEQLLISKAAEGKNVVRLKGGDPLLFGRGGEEAEALKQAGIPFEIVPGVSSALAVPAYAGIPLTHRNYASVLTIITGHEEPAKKSSAIGWETVAKLKGTKVILMGVERIGAIVRSLIESGMDPKTPLAIISWGTFPYQKVVESTLGDILSGTHSIFTPPAIIVIGEVVRLRKELQWFENKPLYGQRVVVTRTKEACSRLAKRLIELGAEVLEIPTIRIIPQPLDAKQKQILENIDAFYDWLLFTSPTAVDIFFDQFLQFTNDIRQLGKVKLGAIGKSTARAIASFHLHVDVIPEKFTSISLGECFYQRRIEGLRFLLPRSSLADDSLANALKTQGASVDQWSLYAIEPETEDVRGHRERFKHIGAHWILFASASSVRYWHQLNLQCHDTSLIPKVVSIGPLTTKALKDFQQEVYVESKEHSIDGLIETLLQVVKQNRAGD